MLRALAAAGALLAIAAAAMPASAQVRPDARWQTIVTPHFRVHFEPTLDSLAYRAAESAERAWARLARELETPRGPIDIVVADNVDYSNGYATFFPTNRIVVYATAPADAGALRQYADWMDLVVSHELVHIFHLDQAGGWWEAAQRILGRNPLLFPAAYQPSWLTEGLAVYYETRLTGSGRLAGTSHRAYAHAAAIGGTAPRIDQLSAVTPAFPGGSVSYVYGSLLMEQLAAARPQGMRWFIDRMSAEPIPFRLEHVARKAFGRTFQQAWREWRDSVARDAASRPGATGAALWNPVTSEGWFAQSPRWRGDGESLVYAAGPGRAVQGAFEVTFAEGDTTARRRRLGRRTSLDANVPMPDGGVLYAQLEYTGLYTVRSDLWTQHGRRTRQLTHGERLSSPDVRGDGAIVAVQVVPGTTRLVLLDSAGRALRAITAAHVDTQWAEPRWSPDGRRIAAVRRARGGRSSIVVLDAEGGGARELSASDRVEASPAWSPDGAQVFFTSDRRGPAELMSVRVDDEAAPLRVLAEPRATAAGVYWPDLSPRMWGGAIAAVTLEARGFHVVVGDVPPAYDTLPRFDVARDAPRLALADTIASAAVARVRAARPGAYRGARSLLPRWWLPISDVTDAGEDLVGFATSGSDIVGRHAYGVQLMTQPSAPEEVEGTLSWRWAGLGQPLVDLWASQEWEHYPVVDSTGATVGTARRSSRVGSLGVTLVRPRIYSSVALAAGGDVEHVGRFALAESADPELRLVAPPTAMLPGAWVAITASALQRAPLAISAEDGLAFAGRVRQQWQGDLNRDPGRTVIGSLRAYKSFDLPGYSRHVLALRVSGAATNAASSDDISIGGTSGGALEVLPGYVVGDAARTFGVRGFSAGVARGSRARGASAEWRAPLVLAGRGYGILPLFLSRTGVNVFADGAEAWCADGATTAVCRFGHPGRARLASAGAELFADAALGFDALYRIRGGVAFTRTDATLADAPRGAVLYATFGTSF